MTTTNVALLTPILRTNSPFLNAVEKYTWFGERVVQVIFEGPDVCYGAYQDRSQTWVDTGLKIASIILTLGFSFLIALIIKVASRSMNKPVIAPPITSNTLSNTAGISKEFIETTFTSLTAQSAPYYEQIRSNAVAVENGLPLSFDLNILNSYHEKYLEAIDGMTDKERLFFYSMDLQLIMGMKMRHPRVDEVLEEIVKLPAPDLNPIDPGRTLA